MNNNYIANRSKGKMKSDILKIGALAKADKASGNHVIDATIGVFLNDDKSINTVPAVIEDLNNNVTKNVGYAPITGYPKFKEGLLKWYLKDQYNKVINDYNIPFGATLGGTGALSIAFNVFLDPNQVVLLPSIMWGNYKLIAKKAGLKYDTYQLFNSEGNFNITNLCSKIEDYSSSQSNILIVLNDPCQNPTGYSLSNEEHLKLIKKLNKLSEKVNITVIYDIAYLDYDGNNKELHKIFNNLINNEVKFLPVFAASCSKVFGMYGFRVGAIFSLIKDEELASNLTSAIESQIRGTYSSPNGPALSCLANALLGDEVDKLSDQIYNNTLTLKLRTTYFIEKLNTANIKHLPYKSGFFVCLPCSDAYDVCEKLKMKHTYLIPIADDIVRIAVCSLNNEEIDELVMVLKEVM